MRKRRHGGAGDMPRVSWRGSGGGGWWPTAVCLRPSDCPLGAERHCIWPNKLVADAAMAFLGRPAGAQVTDVPQNRSQRRCGFIGSHLCTFHGELLHSDQASRDFWSTVWHCSCRKGTQFLVSPPRVTAGLQRDSLVSAPRPGSAPQPSNPWPCCLRSSISGFQTWPLPQGNELLVSLEASSVCHCDGSSSIHTTRRVRGIKLRQAVTP